MSATPGRNRPTQLVVIDSTFTVESHDFELSSLPGVDSAAVADFRRRNRESRPLRYLVSSALGVPIVLVSRKTLESFLGDDPEQYWREFYRRYPGSPGSIAFSS